MTGMGVLIDIIVIVAICGILAWLINAAPFLDATIKQFGVYAIIAVAAILILLQLVPLLKSLA